MQQKCMGKPAPGGGVKSCLGVTFLKKERATNIFSHWEKNNTSPVTFQQNHLQSQLILVFCDQLSTLGGVGTKWRRPLVEKAGVLFAMLLLCTLKMSSCAHGSWFILSTGC